MTSLYWLPEISDWRDALNSARQMSDVEKRWHDYVALANRNIDFIQTNALDRAAQSDFSEVPPPGLVTRPIRLAILSSSTTDHLIPAIRVGAMRRGIWLQVYSCDYGQYQQALLGAEDGLNEFQPDTILFLIDSRHAVSLGPTPQIATDRLANLWKQAHAINGASVVQTTFAPVFPHLLGIQEFRFKDSPATYLRAMNDLLRNRADTESVSLIDLEVQIARDGLHAWCDHGLWYRAKQEIHPAASPFFGDLVGRLIGARQGLSAKALVLDLDNTLWGGVIGDDGLDGIRLGQGDAAGEAFTEFQSYAKALTQRGIILAVCSKNDEANALAPFEHHPDMILKRDDFAAFVANWDDKATNLRRIASMLNIGVDALVFADDNPFERNLVRRELPMIRTPELPEDPALFSSCLAEAGFFEGLGVTAEDTERAAQYRANAKRESLKTANTDLEGYLKSLNLELSWKVFDQVGLPRIAQLINKTNQFNLTTKRRSESEIEVLMTDPSNLTLQLRLKDNFGDNGMISVVIAKPEANNETVFVVDTWLMSCRVLGRQVEEATMNILAEQALARGARHIRGRYVPTSKNGMVSLHYGKLGFEPDGDDGETKLWRLDLASYAPRNTHIQIIEVQDE